MSTGLPPLSPRLHLKQMPDREPAIFHPRFTPRYQDAGNVWFDAFHIQTTDD